VFKGGDQGWVDLKLAHIEDLSHNVKRFRFEFPDKEQVSGLKIACTKRSAFYDLSIGVLTVQPLS
jgi:cytochrome-b5 reductase